jgi:hypothetical protein
MSDLNMLAVTGGRERSEHRWRGLLETAGFWLPEVYPVGNDVGVLEAKPDSTLWVPRFAVENPSSISIL